jgi:hypothetical protein
VLEEELQTEGLAGRTLVFRLEARSIFLDRAAALVWIKESVDEEASNSSLRLRLSSVPLILRVRWTQPSRYAEP